MNKVQNAANPCLLQLIYPEIMVCMGKDTSKDFVALSGDVVAFEKQFAGSP